MYRANENNQNSFLDFNQPLGLHMNPNNRWVKKAEYQDNVDRIEVERVFSLAKHSYGLGLIRTKLENTTPTAIALSIFIMNLFKVSLHHFLNLNKTIRKRLNNLLENFQLQIILCACLKKLLNQ